MRLEALLLVVLVNAYICTLGARELPSEKTSFDDSATIFHDPFSGATGSDELGAGALGSGIDVPGLGSLLGGGLGGDAGFRGGVRAGFGVRGGLGGSGFAIGGSLTSGGANVGGGFRAGLP